MRKDIFLPVLALAGGAVGFLLRLWQYASAYDPATELFAHGAPASLALVVWTVLMGALALLLGRGGAAAEKPEESFLCPSTGYMTFMAAGGMCFLLSAAAGVPELMYQYQAWQIDPQHNMLPVAFGLSVLFCLAGSIGALVSGLRAEQLPRRHRAPGPGSRRPARLCGSALADGPLSGGLPGPHPDSGIHSPAGGGVPAAGPVSAGGLLLPPPPPCPLHLLCGHGHLSGACIPGGPP